MTTLNTDGNGVQSNFGANKENKRWYLEKKAWQESTELERECFSVRLRKSTSKCVHFFQLQVACSIANIFPFSVQRVIVSRLHLKKNIMVFELK